MAVVASDAAGYVIDVFAACCYSIMARTAGTKDLSVIDQVCRSPDINAVAILTNSRCLNVHRILASRVDTVMAAGAVTADIDVIEISRQPGHGRMAVVTIVAAGEMVEVLTGCRDAIVTGSTTTKYLRMIDHVGW